MKRIAIYSKVIGEVTAELYEEQSPRTVEAIYSALPLRAKVNRWGDEIYFSIGVDIAEENAQTVVEKGDLGYWPPGKAFCIFFGTTPASRGGEIRAASPVNVFGKVLREPEVFKKVKSGEELSVKRVED